MSLLAVFSLGCGGVAVSQTAVKGLAPFGEQLEHDGPESLIKGCSSSEISPPALSPEQRAAFDWLDGLGFPDLTCRKLVRVATGQWRQHGNRPRENTFQVGFLLGDDGSEFTVITFDLFIRSFVRTSKDKPEDKPEPERVGYEVLDLPGAVFEYLDLLERLAAGEDDDLHEVQWRRFGERLAERSELFVMARACAASHHVSAAHALLDFAAKMPERSTGKPPEGSLTETLAREIAHAMTWRAVEAFEDYSIPRTRLLAKFEWLLARFPENEHLERVEQTVAMLQQMVAEDAAHPARDLDALSGDELIEELMFQLRNQNGHQWSQPGWCDVFIDDRGDKSPAHRLAAVGYPAVPRLIEALEDERLSRSVGFHRNFYFSHTVLTVGDVALAVLQKIAGRGFYVPATTNSQMHKDDEVRAVKAEVEKWWTTFQKKGEQGVLAEAVAAGDRNSSSQAHLLVERYPEGALEKIVEGVRNAENAWVREDLVSVAAGIEGDGPVRFLRDELERGPHLGARVAAAVGLHLRGRSEAMTAMIDEWRGFYEPDPDGERAFGKLIEFLAGCGEESAVRALGTDLDSRPVDVRLNVISALGEVGSEYSVFSSGIGGGFNPGEKRDLEPSVAAAIEELLMGRLEDFEEREGMSGSWDGKSFADPRICDVAGHVLTQQFGQRYEFDLGASLAKRERQRIAAINVWRRAQGLDELPVPESPVVSEVSPAQLSPILAEIEGAVDEAAASDPLKRLERLGLGALAPARELLDRLPDDHAGRATLGEAVGRLALIVRESSVVPSGRAQAVEKRLGRLRGSPLTAKALVKLLVWVAGHLPDGTVGIKLKVDRPGDGTGAIVAIRLLTKRVEQEGSPGWHTNTLIAAGGEVLLSSSGTSSREHQLEHGAWEDEEKSLRRALQSGPEVELRFRETLVLEK